jgi:beta-glucanase (GH16 family)
MKKIILGCIFAAIVMISSLAFMTNKDLTTRSGDEWQLIWSDEFEGPELNTNFWNRQVEKAGRFNEEWQRYTNKKANAYLENNCLVIEAIHHGKKHGMDQYSSARLNTAGKFTFKYGKVSARIKLPYGMGIWPAFWMLGANIDENGGDTPWPLCGEIDILELYGSKNDAVVEANIHYADASGRHAMMGSESFELDRGIFADDFHLFELEWTPKTISWSVDGKTYASTSIASEEFSEFHKEFFLLLNIAVGGTFAGRPDSSSVFPQKMYVDWIRVYQKPE